MLFSGALAYLIATSRPRPSGNAPYPDAEGEEVMPPVSHGAGRDRRWGPRGGLTAAPGSGLFKVSADVLPGTGTGTSARCRLPRSVTRTGPGRVGVGPAC